MANNTNKPVETTGVKQTNMEKKSVDKPTATTEAKQPTVTEKKVESKPTEVKKSELGKKVVNKPYLMAVKRVLDSYVYNMGNNLSEKQYVGQQNNLYQQLKSILATVDYNQFKEKWDIVNQYFREKDVLQPMKLYRYDYVQGSPLIDKSFLGLLSILTELNNPANRKEKLKGFDINKAIKEVTLGEPTVSNLLRYYAN